MRSIYWKNKSINFLNLWLHFKISISKKKEIQTSEIESMNQICFCFVNNYFNLINVKIALVFSKAIKYNSKSAQNKVKLRVKINLEEIFSL